MFVVQMSFEFFLEFHNSLHNKNYFQHMKIKEMSWGYYISSPLILNTVLGVLFILSSLAHFGTWRDILPTFYPPFPKLPLQG